MKSNPLKWHGGKSYLADWIISHFPSHTRYVEPFFGGGAVLFRKPCEGVAEWANDIHGQLINFWRVLRDPDAFPLFRQRCEATPLSESEFEFCKRYRTQFQDYVEAWKFFIRYRQSRQGLGKDYCTPTSRTRRGMNENVSAWLSAVEGLPEAHERLKRVEIWNRPAIDCIQRLDSPETLFYCDPPYLHETRSSTGEYEHEMTAEDHEQLLRTLQGISGKFVLSGYRSHVYDLFAEFNGWRRVERQIDNKSSSKRTKDQRTECLWMNF